MQIASAYYMLSFERSEAYIIIFSVNYNELQMSVQPIVNYDRFYDFWQLCKFEIDYTSCDPFTINLKNVSNSEHCLQLQ